MGKYVFKFQSMLGIKEKIEEQKKIEYGNAVKELEEQKKKLLLLEANTKETVLSFKRDVSNNINASMLKDYNFYIDKLKREILNQNEVVNKHEEIKVQKQKELSIALAERKSFEKLKENSQEQFLIDTKIKEQKAMDEIVSFRFK